MHNDIDLLKRGVIMPKFKVLSSFFDRMIKKGDRVLDINCKDGYLLEMIHIMHLENVDYVGVDPNLNNIKRANEKNLDGSFKNISYDKMKLHSDSYDLIIAQDNFLDCDNMFEKIDNLFRATRKWIVFYNIPVIPECDSYQMVNSDEGSDCVHGVAFIHEILSIMEPVSVQHSYITKGEDPAKPTSSIFVVRV